MSGSRSRWPTVVRCWAVRDEVRARPVHVPADPVARAPSLVAELGYEWIELSPRDDFTPFFTHPRVDDAGVAAFKKALAAAGVGVSSVLPLYRWSGPDEDERQAAVRYWKRAIQIASDLGVDTMNSEFNGNPRDAAVCEQMFWRSMDELLPELERAGVRIVLEPHPDDWEEDGKRAVDLSSAGSTARTCRSSTAHRTPSTRATTAPGSWTGPATW